MTKVAAALRQVRKRSLRPLKSAHFSAYAKLCGGKGFRVTKAEQLESALGDALAHAGPALVEIITDPYLI